MLSVFTPAVVRRVLGAVALALAAQGASAQPRDDALYRALGGQPGLTALVDDLVGRLLLDPRTEPFFRDADAPKLRSELVTQFCELAGGPCKRTGKDMASVHAGQDIRRTDFNAVVEVLQQSLDAHQVGFATQSRLLALLAPMHREIVNTR